MTSSPPLAVGLVPMETRREAVLRVATRAEELGYTEFTVAEGWGIEAGVLLAEVAGKTSRIRLGTGILNICGRSPATIAMLAAGLAEVTGQVRRLLDGERLVPTVPGRSRPLRLAVRPPERTRINLAALGPRAVRLCGELADAWLPFLLPLSRLDDGIRLLERGAARGDGRPLPQVRPLSPSRWRTTSAVTSSWPAGG